MLLSRIVLICQILYRKLPQGPIRWEIKILNASLLCLESSKVITVVRIGSHIMNNARYASNEDKANALQLFLRGDVSQVQSRTRLIWYLCYSSRVYFPTDHAWLIIYSIWAAYVPPKDWEGYGTMMWKAVQHHFEWIQSWVQCCYLKNMEP